LEEAGKGNIKPSKKELFAGMISNAWYTVNYFHVSFGKQDMVQRAIENIKCVEKLFVDERRDKIHAILKVSENKLTARELKHFNKEVPWRFLSPWIKSNNDKEVALISQSFENNCLYALYEEYIEINPKWLNYITENAGILKSFCYWKLSLYLQKHNPNVPDIPNKLIKPAIRNGLVKQRIYWDLVLEEVGSINCIYTSKALQKGEYAVEHFIPHAFVSHDLMWNLIPSDKSFSSLKSDKLPPLDVYFEAFFDVQFLGMEIMKYRHSKNKNLEDYLTIFPNFSSTVIDKEIVKQRMREQIQPLISIAANNGFEFLKYRNGAKS
jgi:hypothetical protein